MDRFRPFATRPPRVDVRRTAVLVDSDGRESDVIVLDVSSGGFRLQISETVREGELVTLRVEHGEELKGQIRWVLGNEAGGALLTPPETQSI